MWKCNGLSLLLNAYQGGRKVLEEIKRQHYQIGGLQWSIPNSQYYGTEQFRKIHDQLRLLVINLSEISNSDRA